MADKDNIPEVDHIVHTDCQVDENTAFYNDLPEMTKLKIGITIDGTKPKVTKNAKTGAVMKSIISMRQSNLRLAAKVPGWKYCDTLGREGGFRILHN
ncbi:hypothetical protein FQN55_005982 [Onygenales sp. PD_40]|nr:hypothetical protein FQN55_005982 [Onygenales sp. PD_40]KAK2791113.1 hypothetical protein FQN52_005069 [Onygenales sp. PD_12]KAK2799660.1 hypothetical protein FQN51_006792 [Onygenales sp. PD_10]